MHPGKSITKSTDPEFKFLRDEPDAILKVKWKILNEKTNDIINQDFRDIEVISKKYVYWDLKDPEGNNVPLDFILASLSAWTLNPDEVIRNRAGKFLSETHPGIDSPESSRQWFKKCYLGLFHGSRCLGVRPHSEPWPLPGKGDESKQQVRPPVEILNVKDPDSLEAVLLVSALRNTVSKIIKSRLALFVLPKQEEGHMGSKQFLLSWSTSGKDWYALDMTNPNKISFEENESRATSSLSNLLKSREEILLALNSRGVFIDEKRLILALGFDKAPKSFQISGLP